MTFVMGLPGTVLIWIATGLISPIWDWAIYPMLGEWRFWVFFLMTGTALIIADSVGRYKEAHKGGI